jgi:ATP-dependent Lon protease
MSMATNSISMALPVAGYKRVYDCTKVEDALSEISPGQNDALRDTYEKMLKAGGTRFAVKPSSLPAMDALYHDLPNFGSALDDIKRQLSLCVQSKDPLEISPMLLLGDPGIGKTHFAKRLSHLLGTGFGFISMSALTAGWIIGGTSSQWKNAKPGKVFETFLRGDYANPVMVVDEIDKAGGESTYDPLGAMYSLLEHDTAREFIDEFVELPIDASEVVWIATANDARSIPDPILNRMNVYEIEPPDHDAACRIAQSIYTEIRTSHDWGTRFEPTLAPPVQDALAQLTPREMRKALNKAFGNASLAGRDALTLADIEPARAKRARIGF